MEQKLYFKDYNEALKQNKLLGLKCRACGTITIPPKMVCRQCGSPDMEVTEVKTDGKIVTFTTIFVGAEGREGEVPYTVVIVELEEGPWLMGNLEGIDPKAVSTELIGKKVKMDSQVYPGDKYSAGETVRPIFSLVN
jgi:uncharacterized OB-fold protein